MNTLTLTIRNSAITLIALCIITVVVHFVYAFIDYNNQSLSFLVKKTAKVQDENFNGLKFKNKQIGELEIKPTIIQAIILEDGMFNDGGATMFFYLISSLIVLKKIKNKVITLESLTEKNIVKIVWVAAGLFFALYFLIRILLNEYVDTLTMGQFKHDDNLRAFPGFAVLGFVIFNAIYGLIGYTKKLKQENDLTI
jgi:hypothetical protein